MERCRPKETHTLAVLEWEKSESVLGKCLTDPHPLYSHPSWPLPKPVCPVSRPDQGLPVASVTTGGPNSALFLWLE